MEIFINLKSNSNNIAVVWKYNYKSNLINWVGFPNIIQIPHGISIRDDDYLFFNGARYN